MTFLQLPFWYNMFTKYLDPKNDYAFKKIFGEEKHKRIPIAFLNAVLNLEGDDRIIDLEFLNTIQIPEVEARKESIVDVLVRDQRGNKYVVEMQVAKIAGFEKRAQFYAARTYCSHFNCGSKYDELKKVIFLAITSYIVFPQKESYKSEHVILDNITLENDLRDFSFTFIELPKFNKQPHELETIEEKWYYFLKHADESREEIKELADNPEIKEAYKVIEMVNWSERDYLIYDKATMAVADAQGALDAAKEDGEKLGIEKGIEKGIEIGTEKGIEIGTEKGLKIGFEKGKKEALRHVVENLHQQGMNLDQICNIVNMPVNEIKLMLKI